MALPQVQKPKGLARATKSNKTIALTLKDLHERNNTSIERSGLQLLLFTAFIRLFNITFADLQISEFQPVSIQSHKNYALMILSLYISGKAAKSEVITSYGLHYETSKKILSQLTQAGYIEVIINKSLHKWNMKAHYRDVPHLQLTSKGLDLANHIGSLLIDDRLI